VRDGGWDEQTANTLSAMQGRKNEICRKVILSFFISVARWLCVTCALFILFLFFHIQELSVISVDRPVPKNDGRADVFSGPC
jgi:hypothetical protein